MQLMIPNTNKGYSYTRGTFHVIEQSLVENKFMHDLLVIFLKYLHKKF